MIRRFRMSAFALAVLVGCNSKPELDADLLIQHVTVIDGTGAASRADQFVAIKGDRIVAIGPAAEMPTSKSAKIVDGLGKYLIPGLWDMHVHLDGYKEHSFPLFVANGVTGVRDLGGNLAASLKLRELARSGSSPAPDVLIAGPVLDGDYVVRAVAGTAYAAGREAVPDSATGVAMVDSLARAGVDHIKVHSLTPRAAYFAILAEARRKGIPVVGHLPDSISNQEAILGGQRTIEHGSKLEYGETARGEELTRRWLAATQKVIDKTRDHPDVGPIFAIRLAMSDTALAAYDSATAATFGAFAAKHDVWFDPTIVVEETMWRANDSTYRHPDELKYAPKSAQSDEIPVTGTATPAELEAGHVRFTREVNSLLPLLRAGAKFVTGTDLPVPPLPPGFSLLRELELLVHGGFTPMQAIQAATHNSAEAAGKLAELGTVETGKRASLVLLDANPLAAIGNVRRINAVIVKGKLLDRATLDRMLVDAEAYAKKN
ncbi:MAG: amidohydrolase family protein [Gemmatimonadaceae bacterium]